MIKRALGAFALVLLALGLTGCLGLFTVPKVPIPKTPKPTDVVLYFDGAAQSNLVEVIGKVLPDGSEAFTVEALVQWDGGGGGASGRKMFIDGFPNYTFSIEINANNRWSGWMLGDPEIGINSVTSLVAEPGKWYHVALVFKGDEYLRMYINGERRPEADRTPPKGVRTWPLERVIIGGYRGMNDRWWDGKIAYVRIWNAARGESEIAANMYSELIGSEPGLVGYWKLDEGKGNTVYDSSPNGYYGAVIGARWMPEKEPPPVGEEDPDAFTVIVLPDTQIYSQSYPEIFQAQTQWIVDMAEALNIQMVLHAGDVVNQGAKVESQWQNAKAAMDLLDEAGIPTIISIGNHDYDDEAATRASHKFNEYFGINRYLDKPWFGGAFEEGKSDNVYGVVNIGGRDYLFMTLEFGPRHEVVDWANQILTQHSDHEAIVITHAYMDYDNTRLGPGDGANPKSYGVGGNALDGEDLWSELIKRHGNVKLVLSGHVLGTGVGRRTDVGNYGNTVHQVMANYQMRPSGGQGYLRIMRFRPSIGVIEVQTYSPHLKQYMGGPDQDFTLSYEPGTHVVDAARSFR